MVSLEFLAASNLPPAPAPPTIYSFPKTQTFFLIYYWFERRGNVHLDWKEENAAAAAQEPKPEFSSNCVHRLACLIANLGN